MEMVRKEIDLIDMDYRLRGYPVKFILEHVNEKVKHFDNFLSINPIPLSKGIFYNFLKHFNLKKDFCCFVKNHEGSEETLYVPYVKKFLFELRENFNKRARIFETEEEDRKNKRHRKCILHILPLIRDISSLFVYFYVRFCSGEDDRGFFYWDARKRVKSGDNINFHRKGWRHQKRK